MKKQNLFIGVIIIGIGLLFLFDQWQIPFLQELNYWPMFLVIVGLAFLIQSLFSKDKNNIFPGVILLGLGIHFYFRAFIPIWPDSWAVYTLIIGVAFLALHFGAKKKGLFTGTVLCLLSLLVLLAEMSSMVFHRYLPSITQLWPVALILVGLYFLFGKKKH
ncbi:hypothetical protein EV207_101197 [Scopulibacillus darangshiensis]|uniref:Uncharacterized protein n=1 Tax=Scopulibacillus darangshiensis TaxID=442528 RepID=A0A4R2PAV1_9BACL|nr:DUF5668 domain-containing protein [Scopulibacillus darangshiensis]TCP32219.1 hypothetical protein EV207_101197 [Scopulibacillus darangshiensis]